MSTRKSKVTVLNIARHTPTMHVEFEPGVDPLDNEKVIVVSIDGQMVERWSPDPMHEGWVDDAEDMTAVARKQIWAKAAQLWLENFAK